ncbi:MAG: hypothetical protein KJZ47_14610 [Gemmatimonadales bacterium]|nr:hypothetical protein [Gemmatimonadales bacterium]
MTIRQARLRPEFASDYPGIPAGTWMPAADMGFALLRAHLVSPTPPKLGGRLMDEAKFEFQGGRPREPDAPPRTRQGESGAA